MLNLLLSDGTGPAYHGTAAALERALRDARGAMQGERLPGAQPAPAELRARR